MQKYKILSKKNEKFLRKILIISWFDLGTFCLFLISLISIIFVFTFAPMPNSFFYSELDPWSITAGAGKSLIAYGFLGLAAIVAILTYLGLSVFLYREVLLVVKSQKLLSRKLLDGKYFIFKKALYYLILFTGAIVPFALSFYFVKKGYFSEEKLKANFNSSKFKLLGYFASFALIIASNTTFIGIPMTASILIETKPYYNKDNAKKFYQLSQNKNNILYLYFDRTDSGRVGKYIDELDTEHKEAFNEFTFYENNLSISDTTITSVPYLLFGYNGNLIQKKSLNCPLKERKVTTLNDKTSTVTFPGSKNVNVSQLTLEKFYQLCFANFIAFGNYLGYGITNVCNSPYYGKQSPFLFNNNNSYQMNQEMRNDFGFKNFSGTYPGELQKYHGRKVYYNNIDDAYVLGNMKNDFKFVNTDTNVFTAFYSQQNHWDFAVKANNSKNDYRRLSGNSPENLHRAIHDSLIDLSELFLGLKSDHSSVGKKTTIVIVSDHGHCFKNHAEEPSSKERAAGFAPVFMIKPAESGSVNQKLTKDSNCLTTTADQLAIIRNLLFPNGKTPNSLDPLDPTTRYSSINENEGNLLRCYMPDPTKSESGNRKFEVASPLDGRYLYWRDYVDLSGIRHFSWNNEPDNKSIFSSKNGTNILN